MTKEEKLYATAPCGLMCYGCFGNKKGGIPYHASKLQISTAAGIPGMCTDMAKIRHRNSAKN